jgi:ABC-type multidrug transport system fused ATPase/permease subunit
MELLRQLYVFSRCLTLSQFQLSLVLFWINSNAYYVWTIDLVYKNFNFKISDKIKMDNLQIFDYEDICFHHPCNVIISGSTGAGKSTLLGNIIKHREELFYPQPVDLLVAYGQN